MSTYGEQLEDLRELVALTKRALAPAGTLPDDPPTPFDQPSTAQTRREAAQSIRESAPTLREKVYAFIAEHPGVTDERIAESLNMNPSTVRPRRLELVQAGRIEAAGASKTRSGRRAVGWRAADA
jgi:hypothetical protein